MLNEGALQLLVASRGNTVTAQEAASALVAGLLRTIDALQIEIDTGNQTVLEQLTLTGGWPVRHYPFPEDRRLMTLRLAELGFSSRHILNTKAKKHWGRGPASIWAQFFWEIVEKARHDPTCQALRTAPTKLPPLTTNPDTLNAWHRLACEYFTALSPNKNLVQHPDWKFRAVSAAKIRNELKAAFGRIAKKQ